MLRAHKCIEKTLNQLTVDNWFAIAEEIIGLQAKNIDISVLSEQFVHFSSIRPNLQHSLTMVLVALILLNSFNIDEFESCLLNSIYSQKQYKFARTLFQQGVLYETVVKKFIEKKKCFDLAIFLADYIDQSLPFKQASARNTSFCVSKAVEVIKKYQNQKDKLAEVLEWGWEKGSLGIMIKQDQYQQIQAMIDDDLFGINDTIDWSPLETIEKPSTPTLLNISALFGAKKCFDLLLSYNCKITYETVALAFRGGNQEIIDICISEKPFKSEAEPILALIDCWRNEELTKYDTSNLAIQDVCKVMNLTFLENYFHDNIDLRKPDPQSQCMPIHYAAKMGNLMLLKYIISREKGNITTQCRRHMTPLHYSIESGNVPAFEYLIELQPPKPIENLPKSSIIPPALLGRTPLMLAALSGDAVMFEVVRALLGSPSVRDVDMGKWTAIMFAAMADSTALVDLIAEYAREEGEDDPLAYAGAGGHGLAFAAAQGGAVSVLRMLVETGHYDPAGYEECVKVAKSHKVRQLLRQLQDMARKE